LINKKDGIVSNGYQTFYFEEQSLEDLLSEEMNKERKAEKEQRRGKRSEREQKS
jgi:hypothetical protein